MLCFLLSLPFERNRADLKARPDFLLSLKLEHVEFSAELDLSEFVLVRQLRSLHLHDCYNAGGFLSGLTKSKHTLQLRIFRLSFSSPAEERKSRSNLYPFLLSFQGLEEL